MLSWGMNRLLYLQLWNYLTFCVLIYTYNSVTLITTQGGLTENKKKHEMIKPRHYHVVTRYLSKIDEIHQWISSNRISIISMHISNLVKIYWDLLKLLSWNNKCECFRQITLSKIAEIYQWAIPKQISTISMHISNLVKIYWDLLKLLSWN